jgi:surface antigen
LYKLYLKKYNIMATTKTTKATKATKEEFATIPAGTEVTWDYRSAIGHGTVKSIFKKGTNADTTEYSIEEHDHHPGEPAIVHHYGKALTRKK